MTFPGFLSDIRPTLLAKLPPIASLVLAPPAPYPPTDATCSPSLICDTKTIWLAMTFPGFLSDIRPTLLVRTPPISWVVLTPPAPCHPTSAACSQSSICDTKTPSQAVTCPGFLFYIPPTLLARHPPKVLLGPSVQKSASSKQKRENSTTLAPAKANASRTESCKQYKAVRWEHALPAEKKTSTRLIGIPGQAMQSCHTTSNTSCDTQTERKARNLHIQCQRPYVTSCTHVIPSVPHHATHRQEEKLATCSYDVKHHYFRSMYIQNTTTLMQSSLKCSVWILQRIHTRIINATRAMKVKQKTTCVASSDYQRVCAQTNFRGK